MARQHAGIAVINEGHHIRRW